MLCSIRGLFDYQKFEVESADGATLGHIKDFLIDDTLWVVRYFDVALGQGFERREVLLSPHGVERIDFERRVVHLRVNRKAVELCPDIGRDPPASFESERAYFDYFGWSYYWAGPHIWGNSGKPIPEPHFGETMNADQRHTWFERRPNAHLHLASQMMTCALEALDGQAGFVEDFVVDVGTWSLTRVVCNLASWWPLTESVLVAPQNVARYNWRSKRLELALRREDLRRAPRYNPAETLGSPEQRSDHESLAFPREAAGKG